MVHGQPLRNLHLGSGSQQTSVLDTHPMYFPTLPAYSIQAQASSQPTMKWTAANSNTHSLEDGESGYGSTLPPSVTHNGVVRIPHSVAGPNSAVSRTMMPPDGAGQDSYVDMYGSWGRTFHEQAYFESLASSYTPHDILNMRSTPPRFKSRASTAGGGSQGSQLPALGGRVILAPPPTSINYPGMDFYPTMSYNTLESRGPPIEAWNDHHNPHTEARPYRPEQRLESTPISARPGEERIDIPGYPESSGVHNHDNGGVRCMGHIVELPPDPRSDRLLIQLAGVQRRGSDRKAKPVMGPDKVAPAQNYAYRGESDVSTTVEPPVTPVIIHDSPRVLLIRQSLYECATTQEGWVKQAPIEFGRIKLTDAANERYLNARSGTDKVLNYEGVGSSILCRLIFSGEEIGKLKILTTNHRKFRESITKAKLAYEVAKLVKRHIERIRAETGYHNMAFENIILTKLLHVSKASWQPELWYEVPVPGLGPP